MAKTSLPTSRAKTAYGLLSEIRRIILQEPKRYNQHAWLSRGRRVIDDYGDKAPSCGTVGCVAGWTCALKAPKARGSYGVMAVPAIRVLGLTNAQADELFDSFAAGGYNVGVQTVKHARLGARHIAAFQKKYTAQLKAKRV